MKKAIELELEAIFQSFSTRHVCAVNLNIISPTVDLKSRDTVNRMINTDLDIT